MADGATDPVPLPPSSTRRPQTVLAALGSAAVLVSLILGYLLVKANREGDANRRTIAEQQATIDQLRAESGMWQAMAARPADTGAKPTPSPTKPTGQQLRTGSLVLPFLSCVDLDTPATENWRMTNADCGSGADVQLGPDAQGLVHRTSGGIQRMWGPKTSFQDCARIGTDDQPIPYHYIFLETQICARTSEGNVALLEVVAAVIKGHPDQITFNVTVWVA